MKHDERPIEEVIRQAFLNAYPNPQRIGCPGTSVLKALAEQRSSGSAELTEHMSRCSPCTQEFLDIKRAWQQRRNRGRWALVAGLWAIAAGIPLWLFVQVGREGRPHMGGEKAPATPLVAVLDYRQRTLRGADRSATLQSVSRTTKELRILLARGTETGAYAVALQRPAHVGQDLAVFSGDASASSNGIVTVRAKVDLSRFAPGEYVVAWRHGTSEDYASFLISR